jgi:hypothetical protein
MVDVADSLNGELPKIIHPGWQTLSMTDRARICTALIEARWALCRRLLRAAILDCRPVDDALHQPHAHMNVAGNIGQEFGVSGRGKSAPQSSRLPRKPIDILPVVDSGETVPE